MSFVWLLCLCGTAPQKSLQMYGFFSVIPNLFSRPDKKKPCDVFYFFTQRTDIAVAQPIVGDHVYRSSRL